MDCKFNILGDDYWVQEFIEHTKNIKLRGVVSVSYDDIITVTKYPNGLFVVHAEMELDIVEENDNLVVLNSKSHDIIR